MVTRPRGLWKIQSRVRSRAGSGSPSMVMTSSSVTLSAGESMTLAVHAQRGRPGSWLPRPGGGHAGARNRLGDALPAKPASGSASTVPTRRLRSHSSGKTPPPQGGASAWHRLPVRRGPSCGEHHPPRGSWRCHVGRRLPGSGVLFGAVVVPVGTGLIVLRNVGHSRPYQSRHPQARAPCAPGDRFNGVARSDRNYSALTGVGSAHAGRRTRRRSETARPPRRK